MTFSHNGRKIYFYHFRFNEYRPRFLPIICCSKQTMVFTFLFFLKKMLPTAPVNDYFIWKHSLFQQMQYALKALVLIYGYNDSLHRTKLQGTQANFLPLSPDNILQKFRRVWALFITSHVYTTWQSRQLLHPNTHIHARTHKPRPHFHLPHAQGSAIAQANSYLVWELLARFCISSSVHLTMRPRLVNLHLHQLCSRPICRPREGRLFHLPEQINKEQNRKKGAGLSNRVPTRRKWQATSQCLT